MYEPKSSNSVPQNCTALSGFSTISAIQEMEVSQFCIDDDIGEKAGHSSTNSYQVNINQNIQEEITKQLKEIEGEMSLAFEFKENELQELRNQVKVLEQRFKEQKQANILIEDVSKTKEKKISDLKLVISRLEQCLNNNKVSNSKRIDTFLKEIGEKSQTIKNLTIKLKEMDKVKQDCEKNEIRKTPEAIQLKMKKNNFDKLNKSHKDMLSQLNQENLNIIFEDRSTQAVIIDDNLLIEENACLKKERQKMFQTFLDMLKKFKIDFENLKYFAKEQLAEWSLKLVEHVKQLKAEYSTHVKFYHDHFIETKQKLEAIQKAFIVIKSDCLQNLEYYKIEICEKYYEDVMNKLNQHNVEFEKRRMDFVKLQEDIDYNKKSEQRSAKAEVQELQECIEVQKIFYKDLQDEYSHYQVNEKKKWNDKLLETENKWLEKIDKYKKLMDSEHRDEIEALTNEWANERKQNALLKNAACKNEKALEKIIQDVEATSQREEALQRRTIKLNKELSVLKKMYRNEVHCSKRKNNDGDDNSEKCGYEMEYIRNILYEYMMGKQPIVLAKVLAALVKFDSNQLNAILKKEEQKVSLLKTLGL